MLPELGLHAPGLFLLMLAIVAVLSPAQLSFAALRRKAELFVYGLLYLTFSRDARFGLPVDSGKSKGTVVKTKRVVFVRHGESVWNECFNRDFGPAFVLRLFRSLSREVASLLALDSCFLDSPLSEEGFSQAASLAQFVEGEDGVEFRQLCETAAFVTSPLRRAAETMLIGFRQALGGGRPVWVQSSLQEISRNVDTIALATPHRPPPLPEPVNAGVSAPPRCLEPIFHAGNKGLLGNGAQRLDSFCEWIFSDCSPATLQPTLVVAGHSFWFRAFFQAYLPHSAYHQCKSAKIVNCGVVVFTIEQLKPPEGGCPEYRIVPDSVVSLFGGFETKGSKTSKNAPLGVPENKKQA